MFSLEALWIAFTLLCAALVDLALHLRSRASLDAFNGSHIRPWDPFSASSETLFQVPWLKAAAASSEVTAAVCSLFSCRPKGDQWQLIRPRLSTCYRYPGLRKADACGWLLQRAPALPWPLALQLQQLWRELGFVFRRSTPHRL